MSEVHEKMLTAIRDHHRRHGYPPSYGDLRRAMGFRSRSAVEYHLRILEQQGAITRDPGTARSVRVVPARRRQGRA